MTRYNIDTCALLVELSVSQWTARKLDKSTTEELVSNKHAQNKGAARVNKHLFAGRSELEVINQHVTEIRSYIYDNTLPWSDSGIRLLPSVKFMEFNTKMQEYEDKFYGLVKEFVTVYPSLITAQAMALGDMFNRHDYPAPNDIEHRFNRRHAFFQCDVCGHHAQLFAIFSNQAEQLHHGLVAFGLLEQMTLNLLNRSGQWPMQEWLAITQCTWFALECGQVMPWIVSGLMFGKAAWVRC